MWAAGWASLEEVGLGGVAWADAWFDDLLETGLAAPTVAPDGTETKNWIFGLALGREVSAGKRII